VKGQKVYEVPFWVNGPHMYITVNINGDSHTFLFDTGASGNIISIKMAQEMNLDLKNETKVRSFGGIQKAYNVTLPSVQFGQWEQEQMEALAIPNVTSAHVEYVGVIGNQFLLDKVVKVDYEKEILYIYEQCQDLKGEIVWPVSIQGGLPVVDVSLSTDEGTPINGKMVVDTGADAYLIVVSEAEKQYKLAEKFKKKIEESTYSPSGAFKTTLGRVDQAKIHKLTFSEVPCKVIAATEHTGPLRGNQIGFIGNHILKRYNLTFDLPNNKMYLSPNSYSELPYSANLAGFKFMANSQRNFVVMDVVKNGTMHKAGVQAGDIIVEVNGRKASDTLVEEFMSLFSSEGNRIHVTIMRNKHTIQLELKVCDAL
jgi:predicted aspartyl protease